MILPLEKIYVWRGYHTSALLPLIERVWNSNECLILCPQKLSDVRFLTQIPAESVEWLGKWPSKMSTDRNQCEVSFPDRPVLGVFTTGTTSGRPRLVLYSKKNIDASLNGIMNFFDSSRITSIFCYPQPFHTFGLLIGYVLSYLKGYSLFIPDGKYSEASHKRRAAIQDPGLLTLGAPTHFLDLLSWCDQSKISLAPSYSAIIGGAPVSPELWQRLRSELKITEPSIGYGASEASPAVTHLPPGQVPKEVGEIGYPLQHLEVQIRSDGIEFSGSSVCLAIIEGESIQFPRSVLLSDSVSRRPDGVFVYHGRHDFVLNRGGEKFPLEQMEARLKERFQKEFACVSIPEPRLGEELGIVVQTEGPFSFDEQTRFFSFLKTEFGKNFNAEFVYSVERLPLLENLKIDRRACRNLIVQQLRKGRDVGSTSISSFS